jgi:hypothetical protein
MAFERIEPFGDAHADKRVKVLAAWICTFLSQSKSFSPDDITGISPEMPPLERDPDDVDEGFDADEPFDAENVGPSSADVLRDIAEQNLFR